MPTIKILALTDAEVEKVDYRKLKHMALELAETVATTSRPPDNQAYLTGLAQVYATLALAEAQRKE